MNLVTTLEQANGVSADSGVGSGLLGIGATFALIIGIFVIGIVSGIRKNKRTKAAVATARHLGVLVDDTSKPAPDLPFGLFRKGGRHAVRNQMWRPDSPNSVFEFVYSTGSAGNKNKKWHRFTCALVAVPFWAPPTKIGPESFLSAIGGAVGIDDIQVESQRFNDLYRVTSDDERFAVALLHPELISWFIDHNPYDPRQLRMELNGTWMLMIREGAPTSEHVGFLDWAATVPDHFPDVLESLWPDQAAGPDARPLRLP